MLLEEGATLYHGSYTIVEKPNLNECKRGKDFGRGFYLTTDYNQAKRFARTSVKKALRNNSIRNFTGVGYVSKYSVKSTKGLDIYEFNDADYDWLHCVVAHRREKAFVDVISKWKKYDAICGKIANDNTNLVITAYMDGLYGEIMSENADKMAINFLEPENLKNQICLRTDKAIRVIEFCESMEIKL